MASGKAPKPPRKPRRWWSRRPKNDERDGHLHHDSSRGKTVRNAGDFTRGSQLLRAQWLQAIVGVRYPMLTWLGLFTVAHMIGLYLVMGSHEIQLCTWRLIATLWHLMDLSPDKPVNILLPTDATETVAMGDITGLPEVASAWHRMWMSVFVSMVVATLLTTPATAWFIDKSINRSRDILNDKHERGAMLVSRDVLFEDLIAYNRRKLSDWIARALPGHTLQSVLALPFAKRRELGVHHPYHLSDVPYPYGLEQSHTIVIGTTGAGKTTQLRSLVSQMRERGDSAVIFDLTGAYVEAFHDPARDTILNPLDGRCPAWTIFDDCSTESEFIAAAAALVPSDGSSADTFWPLAARMLFVEMCIALHREGLRTNLALATNLMTCPLETVHAKVRDTIAGPVTDPEVAKMAESVRATFNNNGRALLALPDEGAHYSIANWIRTENKPGSILFITSRHADLELTRTLVTLWMNIAIHTLMTLPSTDRLRTLFIFDEMGALHRLPAISEGMQTARSRGGAFILGLHSFARLKEVYGHEGAENLISLARSKLILTTSDYDSAESCAKAIGNREVRQMDEAYSYGYNSLRDASTLTPQTKIELLVLPDDIQRLPSLEGYVVYPEGMAAARVKLTPRSYPEVSPGFVATTRDYETRARLIREQNPQDEGPSPTNEPSTIDKTIAAEPERLVERQRTETGERDHDPLATDAVASPPGEITLRREEAAEPPINPLDRLNTLPSEARSGPRVEGSPAGNMPAQSAKMDGQSGETASRNVAIKNELMIDQADQSERRHANDQNYNAGKATVQPQSGQTQKQPRDDRSRSHSRGNDHER